MSDLTYRLQIQEIRHIVAMWDLRLESADALATKDATIAGLRSALEDSQQLINRLMHVHVAPDECTSHVKDSARWFAENGGTLAAIADNNVLIRAALEASK